MCYRGQLWAALIGNEQRINAQVYKTFKTDDYTFAHADSNADSSGMVTSRQKMISNSLMVKDIPRTFPHLNKLFEEVHSLSSSLIDILSAFQNYRPDIEYVQGMCFLAAMLLIHQTRPEECFISFSNLILCKFDILYDFYLADHK